MDEALYSARTRVRLFVADNVSFPGFLLLCERFSQRFVADQRVQVADRKHPTHVCIVTWTDGVMSILAQVPIHGVDRSEDRRVLLIDHRDGKVPVLEAIRIAKRIAKANPSIGSSGPRMLA
jgi:hypothetical protein